MASSSPTDFLIQSIRTTLGSSNSNVIPDPNLQFPCSMCRFEVKNNDKSIQCTSCELWSHIKCNGITVDEYAERQNRNRDNPELEDSEVWTCMRCILDDRAEFIPFINFSNNELCNLNSIDNMNLFDLLPNDEVTYNALCINQLSNDDLENSLENINCKYYSCQEFLTLII